MNPCPLRWPLISLGWFLLQPYFPSHALPFVPHPLLLLFLSYTASPLSLCSAVLLFWSFELYWQVSHGARCCVSGLSGSALWLRVLDVLVFSFSSHCVVAIQLLSVQLSVNAWTAAGQASLSFTICRTLPQLMSIESVTSSDHLILCCPLLLLPPIFASIRTFSSESALHIRSKVLELQLQHPSFQWICKVDFL